MLARLQCVAELDSIYFTSYDNRNHEQTIHTSCVGTSASTERRGSDARDITMSATNILHHRVMNESTRSARVALEVTRELSCQAPFAGPPSPRGAERTTLSGCLPAWLRGQLVRVAPSFAITPQWSPAHWFDAPGVVYGLELTGRQDVTLRWAALECDVASAARTGKVPYSQFATRSDRGRLATLLGPIPRQTDNTNVNVVRMGGDWVALTETQHQLILDEVTLETRGRVHYDDRLGNSAMLAHPIIRGGKLTNLATRFKRQVEVDLYEQLGADPRRHARATWRTPELPYMHSFGLTERSGIIIDHPLRVQPKRLLWSNGGFIEHFTWKPETGTRLVVLDRHDGSTRVHETDPFFCFHTVHAFETADSTVLDVIAYQDASIIGALDTSRLRAGMPALQANLLRLTIDRRTGKVSQRPLCDNTLEFPQVDSDFVGTGPHRYVFGAALVRREGVSSSEIVKVDISDGTVRRFTDSSYLFGEPVFVGAPDRHHEGEGVLLSLGASASGTTLFVLDATTLESIARADFGAALPLGFHGSFVSAPA